LPQTFTQNLPPTQNLSTITEGSEHPTFSDIPEVEMLHPANNTSTTTPGSSQNVGGTSSTQTNGGAPHQSPLQASSPIQVIQANAELEQIQIEDWEEARTRRQTAAQRAKARQ
jgi:hypothetical protein